MMTMKEKEIAENKIIPYLEKLGWPLELVSQYGRVPVQMGTDVKWADIVLYIVKNNVKIPYLVLEVKSNLNNIEDAKKQAESYSKFLNTNYFGITDGENHFFFLRNNRGDVIPIKDLPMPDNECLLITEKTKSKPDFMSYKEGEIEKIEYPRELYKKLDRYFEMLKNDENFSSGISALHDVRDIHFALIEKLKKIFNNIDKLKSKEFKNIFDDGTILCKLPNKNRIFEDVDKNFNKIKKFLRIIKNFNGDPEILQRLLDTKNKLHIKGMGIYYITQFLYGAQPEKFVVIEDNLIETLQRLGLIDVHVKKNAKGYLFINDICKKLNATIFKDYVEKYGKEFDFGLANVHNFLWHYNTID